MGISSAYERYHFSLSALPFAQSALSFFFWRVHRGAPCIPIEVHRIAHFESLNVPASCLHTSRCSHPSPPTCHGFKMQSEVWESCPAVNAVDCRTLAPQNSSSWWLLGSNRSNNLVIITCARPLGVRVVCMRIRLTVACW
uniref:Uncharacterized protein n=1 Tax=Noctiluca scintillans TaxID=2966 RepID=A0A7S1FBX6_NOCSC